MSATLTTVSYVGAIILFILSLGGLGWLRVIHETGYRGPYTLELFSVESLPDSLWKTDMTKLLADNRAGFDAAWRTAFSVPSSEFRVQR